MADAIDATKTVLQNINAQLEGVINYVDVWSEYIFSEIENVKDMGTEYTQEVINEKMDELTDKLTEKLQPIREKIVSTLSSQFSAIKDKVEEYIEPISSFVSIDWTSGTVTPNIPTNPADMADALKGVILMMLPAPIFEFVIRFIAEIIPEVTKLSNNIQNIANTQIELPPDLTEIGLTVPPLSIPVEVITPADIIGGGEEEEEEEQEEEQEQEQ